MSIARVTAFFVATSLLAATAIVPAEAHRVLPMVGVHPGDYTVTAMCKPGSYLSGFNGRAGLWVDALQIVCTDGNGTSPQGDVYGGPGGAQASATCANDRERHIEALRIDLTSDGKRIKNLIIYCGAANATGLTRHQLVVDSGADSHSYDKCETFTPKDVLMSYPDAFQVLTTGKDLPGFVKDCSTPPQERGMAQQECPSETFVGMTLRYGKDVNSVGFICDAV